MATMLHYLELKKYGNGKKERAMKTDVFVQDRGMMMTMMKRTRM